MLFSPAFLLPDGVLAAEKKFHAIELFIYQIFKIRIAYKAIFL